MQGNAGNVGLLSEIAASLTLPIAGTVLNQPMVTLLGPLPGRNQFNIDFAVNAKADGTANQVYKGKITYKKTILGIIPVTVVITNRSFNSNASTLPYDYFPGGNINIGDHGFNFQSSTAPNNWTAYFLKYNITASNRPIFGFVPIPSALDIGSGNITLTKTDYLTAYHGATPPTGTKASPFQAFVTAFNGSPDNEQHTLIERRNGDWIAVELTNPTTGPANCNGFCSNFTITGNGVVCTPQTYSIPFVNGISYNWLVQPTGIVDINPPAPPYTNSVQLTRSGTANGQVTLTVTTGTGCGIANLSKSITVGAPTTTCQEIGNGSCNQYNYLCPLQQNNWQYVTLPGSWGAGGTGYHLQISGSGYFSNGLTTQDITTNYFSVFVPSGGNQVAVWAMNSCGVAPMAPYIIFYIPTTYQCPNMFEADPNPASSEVTISPADATASKQNAATVSFTKIEILTKMGVHKKTLNYQAGTNKATIHISFLPADEYIIRVYTGAGWEDHKLLVLR